MHGQGVELDEGALVEQHVDALAGGVLAPCVLLLDGVLPGGGLREGLAAAELGDLAGRGRQVDRFRGVVDAALGHPGAPLG